MKNIILLLSFLGFAMQIIAQTCSIDSINVEPLPCDGDQFNVHLDFNHENVSDSFIVVGNGHTYGTFSYEDLPITLGPLNGDGETVYEFLVCDQLQADCCGSTVIDPVDCTPTDCSIRDLVVEPLPCDGDQFNVHLDFNHENVSDSFTVVGNGHTYGTFSYEDLPITLGPLNGDGETVYEFLVCDQLQADCCGDTVIDPVDCTPTDCSIRDLVVEPLPCDSGLFNIHLDFNYSHTSDSFSVVGNGNDYGMFHYDHLPLELGPFEGDGETNYEFLICDAQQPDCCEDVHIEPVDCHSSNCSIDELIAETHPCENGQFYVDLNFSHQNISDSFTVAGNGVHYGTFSYSDLYITLGPFDSHGSDVLEFIVCDQEYQDCCGEVVIHRPNCDSSACELSNLCIQPNGCDGEEYYMEVDFDYEGVSNNGFDVFIDEEFYGYYSYSDLPLFLESPTGDDGQSHHIKICENDRPDCCVEGLFIAPECSVCAIDELEYEIVSCEEGQFYLSIDFLPFQVQGNEYIIIGENELTGIYEYHDLPQLIGPFDADGETSYTFHIYDVLDPVCSKSLTLDPVDCEMVDINHPGNTRSQDRISWSFYDNILKLRPSIRLEQALLSIHATDGTLQFQKRVQGMAGQSHQFILNTFNSGHYFATLKTNKGVYNYNFIFIK